jgi:predicted dehydrogenase
LWQLSWAVSSRTLLRTKSNGPVDLAGKISRDRAIVAAVGAVGTTLPRKSYYEKELHFRISRSYGPGRYDPAYEDEGHDYPIGYVRWTENRNMAAFAQLLADCSIDVEPLITHRFPIEEGARAYDLITGSESEPFLGVVLTYPLDTPVRRRVEVRPAPTPVDVSTSAAPVATVRIGFVGAGNFATATLLPAMLKVAGLELVGVSTATGSSARTTADKFGFRFAATDEREIFEDPEINTVVVATRHNLHPRQAITAMQAGKDVFVEKPLAMGSEALAEVLRVQRETGRRLMVGFNRRFAPMVREMRAFLQGRKAPLIMICRVNAGPIPSDHWTQDLTVGGGRILGEACHFIDLLQFLAGSPPTQVSAIAARTSAGPIGDEVLLTLSFGDGSAGTIIYTAGGYRSFGKERVEILGDRRVAVLDDYRVLELVRNGKRRRRHERLRPDKGHRGEWEAFVTAARTGDATPTSIADIRSTHLATFAAVESLYSGRPIMLDAQDLLEELPT